MVLVCRVSAWLLLHVYVLVDVLDFVIVLFRNGVFEYILHGEKTGRIIVHWIITM